MIEYKHRIPLPSVYDYVPKNNRRTLTVTLNDFYHLYKKEINVLPKAVYKEMISRVFYGINTDIISGKIYKPPGEKGYISVKKVKALKVNYHRSRARELIKQNISNLHTDGYCFKFHWWRGTYNVRLHPISKIKNQSFYRFKSCRDKVNKEIGQDGLAAEIERRRNDPYEESYDSFRTLPLIFQNRNK